MVEDSKPSLKNVVLPGKREPFIQSNIGPIFYVAFLFFVSLAAIVYFANQEGKISLNQTTLYLILCAIVFCGVFLSDRIQYVFDSQGALILFPSSVKSDSNMVLNASTDGTTGPQKGSGIHSSISMWIYDDEINNTNKDRYFWSRNYYSESDLTVVDDQGNKVPKPDVVQFVSKQPAIHLNAHNNVIYSIQNPSSTKNQDTLSFTSEYTVPKKEWTCVQIVQTQDDVSMYINNRLDSVHTFETIKTPDRIAKGTMVLFPTFPESDKFKGSLSRIYYWSRNATPSELNNVYSIGPVQAGVLYELLKSVLSIPYNFSKAAFVS